jgi:ATP-dependent Lon protease
LANEAEAVNQTLSTTNSQLIADNQTNKQKLLENQNCKEKLKKVIKELHSAKNSPKVNPFKNKKTNSPIEKITKNYRRPTLSWLQKQANFDGDGNR